MKPHERLGRYRMMVGADDPTMLLTVADDAEVEIVRTPTALGGRAERVQDTFRHTCPQKCDRIVRHYVLETCNVAECPECEFGWYHEPAWMTRSRADVQWRAEREQLAKEIASGSGPGQKSSR